VLCTVHRISNDQESYKSRLATAAIIKKASSFANGLAHKTKAHFIPAAATQKILASSPAPLFPASRDPRFSRPVELAHRPLRIPSRARETYLYTRPTAARALPLHPVLDTKIRTLYRTTTTTTNTTTNRSKPPRRRA